MLPHRAFMLASAAKRPLCAPILAGRARNGHMRDKRRILPLGHPSDRACATVRTPLTGVTACCRRRLRLLAIAVRRRGFASPAARPLAAQVADRAGTVARLAAPAAISPRAMPARSATPPRPPPTTARRCAAIRRIPNCSSAPSCRCWPKATSRKRCGSPSASSQVDKNDRIARLVLGVRALKQKQYAPRAQQPRAVGARPDHRSRRDAAVGLGAATAPATPRAPSRRSTSCRAPDWYALFKDLHAGLILDLAGNKKEAGKRFERAYKLDATALRVVEAYGTLAVAQRQRRTRR